MKKIIFLLFTIASTQIFAQMINANAYFRMDDPGSTSMNELIYENDSLYFKFNMARDFVGVSVKNKGNRTITIVWDESVLAVNGISDKSAIIGERRTVDIPSSKVPKNTALNEVKLTQRDKHTLIHHPDLFTDADFYPKKQGMPIFLSIPIESNGNKTEYEFNFSVFPSSKGPLYLKSSNDMFIRATKLFHVVETNWSDINSIIENIIEEKGTRQKSVISKEIAKIYAEAPKKLFKEASFNQTIISFPEKKYREVVASAICECYLKKEGKEALTND